MSLAPPPPGYVVDLDHPQRLDDIAVYWCYGVGVFFSLLFTAQRIYVKTALRLPWRLDDSLLAVSWVTSMAVQAMIIQTFARKVIGVHIWEISMEHFSSAFMSVWIAAPLYVLAGSCTKVALLVFYLRVSPQQWLRYGVFATIFIIVGYTSCIFFALLFACTPIRKSWDPTIVDGHCLSTAALYIATAVCNVGSDVILFVLPIPMLSGLQMPLKQKLGLFFIFGIGSVTVVTSIIRATLLPTLLTTTDITWDVSTASLLIVIESNLIIVCGMLPTLLKFFRQVCPKLIGESSSRHQQHGHSQEGGANVLSVFKRRPKLGLSKSPHLVTFGSLPVDCSRQSHYEYPLATIDGDMERARSHGSGGGHEGGGGGGGGGGIDTRVEAEHVDGRGGGWARGRRREDGEEEGLKPSSAGSQVPIVTTRIEVSYDRSGEALPGNATGTSF